jgi:hypothetical protein
MKDEAIDINQVLNQLEIKQETKGCAEIVDIERRMSVIEAILAEVAGGNLIARIPIDNKKVDQLTALETGINLILSDLEDEVFQKMKLAEELAALKKKSSRKETGM